jgi:hypothetical protein
MRIGINKKTLFLILNMVQLKRFARLCKMKANRAEGSKSLVDALFARLRTDRSGFVPKSYENKIIYSILATTFKQDEIGCLRQYYHPKESGSTNINKEGVTLLNQSLIPFSIHITPELKYSTIEVPVS